MLDEKNSERDLNDEIVKKAYRFWKIERLVFSYTENDSVEVLQSHDGLKAAQPKDLPAFPLIPVPWGDIPFKKKLPGYNNNYLLSQIQILQILEQQENREAGVKRIIYTMAKCFGYHEHHIAVIIRIMVLKRMLVFPSKENPLIGFRECRICLSTIGRYVIENWINEISYTETTMQFSRIPRNKKLSRRFVKFPIFRAKYPKSVQDDSYIDEDFIYVEEEGSTTLQDYLANLYWYLPRFICLVEAMENWSHVAWQFYDANFSSYDETLRLKFEFRPIASQLKNSAIDSNRKCLSTMVYGLRSNYDEKAAPVKDFRAKVLLSIAERFGYPIPTEIKRRLYLPNVLDRYRHRI